ncbi:hypothetical protein BKA66DRAFT_569133 [Pyrenochaeta sp. MPI-SDFR-AT-0127]|nr:hypothetical protein BKA66DRAFT_569133 [Pyrenochaeta sp. MPI-SDFR-AT-0127]
MSKQHILLLGSTGPTGLLFAEAALKEGYQLTLFVRNPSKLPARITNNSSVTTIQGELSQKDRLEQAARSGATVLVSFLGPASGHKGTPISDGYKLLFPLLIQNKFTRALVLATPSWHAPEDTVTLKWKLVAGSIWLMANSAYTDIVAIGNYVASIPLDKISWTVFRVPILSNAEAANVVNAGYLGEAGMKLSRASMAKWVLGELEAAKWIGKGPTLWE